MSKITFEIKGFDELAKSLEDLGVDIEKEQVEALKEASLSGVHTIRYIDSILF